MLEKAINPHQATPGSVGYDLFTPINFKIQPKEQKTVFIDLAITPPEGYYAQLMSKSGLTVLYELEVKAGVIDPDFTGNIGVVLKNNSDQPIERLAGEQIAQLLFIKVATPILNTSNQLGQDRAGQIWLRGTYKLISGYVSNSNGDCKCYWILFMIPCCCIHKIFKL